MLVLILVLILVMVMVNDRFLDLVDEIDNRKHHLPQQKIGHCFDPTVFCKPRTQHNLYDIVAH
jgi:hypothetical protein